MILGVVGYMGSGKSTVFRTWEQLAVNMPGVKCLDVDKVWRTEPQVIDAINYQMQKISHPLATVMSINDYTLTDPKMLELRKQVVLQTMAEERSIEHRLLDIYHQVVFNYLQREIKQSGSKHLCLEITTPNRQLVNLCDVVVEVITDTVVRKTWIKQRNPSYTDDYISNIWKHQRNMGGLPSSGNMGQGLVVTVSNDGPKIVLERKAELIFNMLD